MKVIIYILFFLAVKANFAIDSTSYYINKSVESLDSGQVDRALKFAKKSISTKNKNIDKLKSNIQIGDVFYKTRQLDSAFFYYNKAERFLDDNSPLELEAHVLLQNSKILRRKTKYIKSLEKLKGALILYKELQDTMKIATVRLNYGNVFSSIYDFENAIVNYHKALKAYKSINKIQKIGSCYNNIGNLYIATKEIDSAFKYMYLTLSIRELSTNKTAKSLCYYNLSTLNLYIENYDSALYYIDKSIETKREAFHPSELLGDYYIKGSIYYAKKDLINAVKYFEMSNKLAIEYQYSIYINETNKYLGFSALDNKKYKDAAIYLNKYVIQTDSIKEASNTSLLEKKLISFEILSDSLDKAHLLLQKENSQIENANLELKKGLAETTSIYQLIFLILSVFTVVTLFFTINKRLKQERKHKIILERQNDELKRTLISKDEKDVLLKEIHHRVKNNLQIINSLIRLQSHYTSAENYQSRIRETENRIRSMALVHEKLYKSEDLSKLDAKKYIEELTENVLDSFQPTTNIEFIIQIPEIKLSIDTLIPLGLILNEIISNSIKYAFDGAKNGNVTLIIEEKEGILLNVSDNGVGANLSYTELSKDSLGMELIESLCDQLSGEFTLNTTNGFCYTFKFDELN